MGTDDKSETGYLGVLARTLDAASAEPDPRTSLTLFLSSCSTALDARTAALFELQPADSHYACTWAIGAQQRPPPLQIVDLATEAHRPQQRLSASLVDFRCFAKTGVCDPIITSSAEGIYLTAPILRGTECIGLLDFTGDTFTPPQAIFARSVATIASLMLARQRTLEFLQAVQQPLDFHKPFESFLDDIIQLVAEASEMPYIALREQTDQDTLECLAYYGFPSNVTKSDLDLRPIASFPTFQRVLATGKSSIEPSIDRSHLQTIRELPATASVRSFVVTPVKVANGVFGTLSFATTFPYEYSPIEIASFESIANGIGVAITNRRHFQNANDGIFKAVRANIVITAVDVAQAARHEARGLLGNMQEKLALVETYVRDPSKSRVDGCLKKIEDLGQEIGRVNISLDKIKTISKPPLRDLQTCVLKDIWENAFALLRGRIDNARIRYSIDNSPIAAPVFPDLLVHAFLNLVLNSVDAFVEHGKKRDRKIRVVLERPDAAAGDIVMRYTDNASGIDPSRLNPKIDGKLRDVRDIFEPGVSSKDGSSGFGLHLARNIMTEHKGSIDLVDWRNGVQFMLRLPRKQP